MTLHHANRRCWNYTAIRRYLHSFVHVLLSNKSRLMLLQISEGRKKREEAARDNVAGRGHENSHQDDLDQKVFMKPSVEQVNEQWARAVVKKGLALDMVDDPEFRKAILMTARAGLTYVDSQKEEPKLPHRKHLTTKQIPALDEKLNAKVLKKIEGLLEETGCMIMSDGWTSTQNRPIINALQSTPAGARFLKAVDTSGDTNDAQDVADLICACIRSVGPENLVAVVMDGACKSSFAIIEKEFPHIICFICPTHSVDNFLKNICSDKSTVTVKDTGEYTWGYDTFSEPIDQTWEVIKYITNHQNSLSTECSGISWQMQTPGRAKRSPLKRSS